MEKSGPKKKITPTKNTKPPVENTKTIEEVTKKVATETKVEVPNKKSKAPLIIGITCGVLLLCGFVVVLALVILPVLGFNKIKSEVTEKVDEVKKTMDEKKEENNDENTDNEENDENIFYKGEKDPRILVMTYEGWLIVKENGEIESEVTNPKVAQADYGSFLFSFYSGKWMPNYSDILVVRSGAWDEEFDWYLSVVDEEGKQMENLYGINGDEMPVDPTFTPDGNISFLIESTVEDPNAWGGVASGGKIIIIDLDGNLVKEYNHTNRLFSGKSGFYWVENDRGITVGSYPLEGHVAWYDGVVLADPELQDATTEVLIETYTDYGEPCLMTMNNNKNKLAIIATDKATYSLNVFTYDMQNKSLQQLTNYNVDSGVFLNEIGISSNGNTIYCSINEVSDYVYSLVALNTDGTQLWKLDNIEMPMSIDN